MTPYLIKGEIDCERTECGACSFLVVAPMSRVCKLHGKAVTLVVAPGAAQARALRCGRCIQAESRARKTTERERLLVDILRCIGERSPSVADILGLPWHDWMGRLRGISARLYNDVLGKKGDDNDR